MDLPIALRRTRRRASLLPTAQHAAPPTPPLTPSAPSTPATPSRRHSSALTPAFSKSSKAKRRVRFSDPGPATPPASSSISTGITPMIRRTSLGYSLDSPSSSVTEATFLPLRQVLDGRIKRRLRRQGLSEEMNLIYDEQRAAKREKKTQAAAAQLELQQLRGEVAEKDREIERLRALQGTDKNTDNDTTIVQDNERVMALERELRVLRNQIDGARGVAEHHDRTSNWTMAARDPFASSDMTELMDDATEIMTEVDMADDVFGDVTMAELQCSTPSRRQRLPSRLDASQATGSTGDCNGGQNSFPTPPATSPAAWIPDPISPVSAPATPVTPTMHLFSTATRSAARPSTLSCVPSPLFSHAPTTAEVDVQACLPDPETDALRDEVASLYSETAKLNRALETYQTLVKAVEETITAAQGVSSPSPLEEQVTLVLRALSDKTAALADLSKSLAALGFNAEGDRQSDASDMVANMAAAFRTARLELEYLTPGEIALPLAAPAAQILDLLLSRLRTLSTSAREADVRVDEYREAESSLKEQLAARVSAMDELAGEITERDTLIEQKNTLLAEKNALLAEKESLLSTQGEGVVELEVGLERLKGAMASYARDMAELEALVQRLERELEAAKDETKTAQAEKAQETDSRISLERELAKTVACYERHQKEMEAMKKKVAVAEAEADSERRDKEQALSRRAAAAVALNQNHGRALALRDARVQELRGEIELVNEALRASHETTRQLRVDNAGMAAALDAEKQRTQSAVATLQAELVRISQLGKDLLGPSLGEDKATPSAPKLLTPGRRVSLRRSTAGTDTDQASREGREGRKRRRYDSGLGLLDEEEAE